MAWAMLLLGRLRVRRAVGFPPDDHDQMALDILQDSLADQGVPQDRDDFTDPAMSYAVVTRQGERTVLDPLLPARRNRAFTAPLPTPDADCEVRRGHSPRGSRRGSRCIPSVPFSPQCPTRDCLILQTP